MLLHRLLATTWSRATHTPENDEGSDHEEAHEEAFDDEGEDDAGDGDQGEVEEDLVEGDDDGEDEGQEDRPAQVAKGRGSNRVAEATRIAAEAKAEAKALREELEASKRNVNQQPRETPQQRQDRLDAMDPDQRTTYLLGEQEQRFQSRLNAIEFNAQDSADRTAFEGLCARNPVAARLKDAVESELERLRKLGFNSPRDTVLKYVIGDKALAGAPKAKAKQERAAAANRDRQTARPGSSRSDVPAGDRRGGSEAEQRRKRLENTFI